MRLVVLLYLRVDVLVDVDVGDWIEWIAGGRAARRGEESYTCSAKCICILRSLSLERDLEGYCA